MSIACSLASGQNGSVPDETIPLLCAPGTSAALCEHAENALKKSFLKCGDRLFLGLITFPTFACDGIAPGRIQLLTPRKCQAVEEFDSASFAAKETTGHADSLNHVLRGRLSINYSASRLRHVTGHVWDEWAPNWQDKYGAEPYVLYDFREQNGAWSEELKLDALPSKLFVTADVDRRPSCAEILRKGPNGPQPGDGFVFGTAATRESRKYKGTIDGFAAALPGFIHRAVATTGAPARNYDKETAYIIDQVRKCASANCSGAAGFQNVSDKVGGYDHDRERGLAMSMGIMGLTVSVIFTGLKSDEGGDMFPIFDEYGIVNASLSPSSAGAEPGTDRDTAAQPASGPPAAHLITDTYSQTMEKIKASASRGNRDSYFALAGLIPEFKVCSAIIDNKCQETGEVVRLPGDLAMPEDFWHASSPSGFGACGRHGRKGPDPPGTEVKLADQKDDKKRYLNCTQIWILSGLRQSLTESLSGNAPSAPTGADSTLRLTRTNASAERTATITAPGNRMHNFNVFYIDTRDFDKGGTLVIDIDIPRSSATDGSFDLFTGDVSIPAQGPPTRPLTGRYDVRKGSSTHLDYHFGHGQVFALGLEGNWFSQKGSTGLVKFRVSVSQ